MKISIYYILHVGSMVLLTAALFQAFAQPQPEHKKKAMMRTGILSLLMLIGGMGLWTVMKYGFQAWIIVKFLCWLGLSGMAGMAYRKPERIPMFTLISVVLVLLGIAAVYTRFGTPAP